MILIDGHYVTIEELNQIARTAKHLWSDNKSYHEDGERAVLGLDELDDLKFINDTLTKEI